MRKKIFLITLLSMVILTGCAKETKKEESKIVENNGMLSYTIDGEKTDIKPSKEDGYIVNKIICDNGSDMMWDNDNWEVELTKINSKDRCKVDFTKDTSKEGYRITVTSNSTSSLDSLSKATTLNGTVKIYSKSKIESVTGCNGIIEDNKIIVSNITSNQTCNIEVEDKTLAGIIKVAYNVDDNRKRTDFSVIDNGTHIDTPSGLTGGLYAAEDDQGTTYYFSGDGSSMNNWVSFAGSMWRIIRINGNGSVRLLYAGTGGEDGYLTDVGQITYSVNKFTSTHPAYVGWRYTYNQDSISVDNDRGNEAKSGAYSVVESWYTTNISNKGLENYIDINTIYCNDRNIASGHTYNTNATFYYAASSRLQTKSQPILNCHPNDSFPRKDIDGNILDVPVGLMTADEVVLAGGLWNTNSPNTYYYLNKNGGSSTGNKWWWTMSPHCFYYSGDSAKHAHVFFVYGSGPEKGLLKKIGVFDYITGYGYGVIRPVISLKSGVLVTSGDGSAESPYEITI